MLVRRPKSSRVTASFKFMASCRWLNPLFCRRDAIFRQIRDSPRCGSQVSVLNLCSCQSRGGDCFESVPGPSCKQSKVLPYAISRKGSRSTADQPGSYEWGYCRISIEPAEFDEDVKYPSVFGATFERELTADYPR
jgi:hypothetical protein